MYFTVLLYGHVNLPLVLLGSTLRTSLELATDSLYRPNLLRAKAVLLYAAGEGQKLMLRE